MRAALAAVTLVLVALGLQLAMVVGVVRPSLFLAFLGYGGLFAGMLLIVPAALRLARGPRGPRPEPPHRDGGGG